MPKDSKKTPAMSEKQRKAETQKAIDKSLTTGQHVGKKK